MNLLKVFINLFQFNRTNWKAVALCIMAATVFWFFNSLNKDHSTTIRFPLMLLYDEQRYVPSSPLPREIAINVHGNGWELFRKSFGLKVPTLTVPVDKPLDGRKIPGAALIGMLGTQLSSLRINYVVTDSIAVPLDERSARKFKITANVADVTFKKGFGRVSPVIVLPDSVTISGPKKWLGKMRDSIVLVLHHTKVDQNIREQVEVAVGSDFIRRDPPVVDVMFEVGPVVTIEKWLRIDGSQLPWGSEIERDSVRAVFETPSRDKEVFESYKFVVKLDVSTIKKGEVKYVIPQVMEQPAWARLLSIDSVKVRHY